MKNGQILSTVYVVNPVLPGTLADKIHPARILILLPESNEWTEEKAYLIKMFEAAGQTLGVDFAIVRLPADCNLSWVSILQATKARDVYLFGVHPKQAGLQSNLIPGLPVSLGDTMIFRTESPLKVENNKQIRATLWEFFQKRYLNIENEQ